MTRPCQHCEVVTINSTACHETGCPDSWINPVTGNGYPAPCWECGFDFVPESKPNKYSTCPDCNEPHQEN